MKEEPIAILKSYNGKKRELTIYKNIIYITVRWRKGKVESIIGLTFLIMLFMHGTVFLLVHNYTRIFFWLFWLSIMWSLVFPKYRIYLESKEIYRQFMHMDLPSLKSNLIGGVDKIFKSGEPVNKGRYYYKLWLSGDRYGKGIPLGSLRKGESSYDYELKTLVIDKITRENAESCHDIDRTQCKTFPFTSNLWSKFPFWYRKRSIFLDKKDGTFVYLHSHYHLVMWLLSISCIYILSFNIYGGDHKLWISIWFLTILFILVMRKFVRNWIYDKENKQLRHKKLVIDFNDIQRIIILTCYPSGSSSFAVKTYQGILLSVELKNGKTEPIISFRPSETYAAKCYICGLSYIADKDFHIDAISDDIFDG